MLCLELGYQLGNLHSKLPASAALFDNLKLEGAVQGSVLSFTCPMQEVVVLRNLSYSCSRKTEKSK